jgi:RNA polymerase sigma-70 factor (sigma-E family)
VLYTDVVDEPVGFREFVDAHSRALLRAAWLLTGEWAAAEDLVQTALAAAWPKWATITTSPEAYVRRVMTTTYLRWQRRRWTGEIATASPPDGSALDAADAVAARRVLLDALGALPRQQRAAIVLRYFADLSEADTAAAMGCSVGAVKSHTSRAIARLRETPSVADILTGGVTR